MLPRPLLNSCKVPTQMCRPRIQNRGLAVSIPGPVDGADIGRASERLADGVYAVLYLVTLAVF
jgi:hypothetical protein